MRCAETCSGWTIKLSDLQYRYATKNKHKQYERYSFVAVFEMGM
jgi:hypothetical protein